MRRLQPNEEGLDAAVRLLEEGELVAFPTETVYGLGADASNPEAVARIFSAKGRPADHPLIVHLPDSAALPEWVDPVPDDARRLIAQFWPGPLTLVMRRASGVPGVITGGQDTVGVRVPNHPAARALLKRFGRAVVAPSANRFGRISPTCAAHVEREFGDEVAAVIDGGACPIGVESTILDLTHEPRLLRPGMVRADAISAVLGYPVVAAQEGEGPRASGRLASHYAPRTPLEWVEPDGLRSRLEALAGRNVVVLARSEAPGPRADVRWVQMPLQPVQFARGLYSALRQADAEAPDRIIVEAVPSSEGWAAIRDRLSRAATAEYP